MKNNADALIFHTALCAAGTTKSLFIAEPNKIWLAIPPALKCLRNWRSWMRIIGGAIILVIAVWLYVVSTRMVNKDKKENHTGCDGNCAGCMSGCMTHTDNDKSH